MSIIFLLKTPRICFSLHNTLLQFQAEFAMSSLSFFVLSYCSIPEPSLLLLVIVLSVLVHLPCVIHNCILSESDRYTGEIMLSCSDSD